MNISRVRAFLAEIAVGAAIFFAVSVTHGQTARVDFFLDNGLEIGGEHSFDRRKYINVHSSVTEKDWAEEPQLFKRLVDELDVYFGRDSGRVTWALTQMREDPKHKGFVDFRYMEHFAKQSRRRDANQPLISQHADREDLIVCSQLFPLWPQSKPINPPDGSPAWQLANADAAGQYLAYWVNMFCGGEGTPRPRMMEILNEPLYELEKHGSDVSPQEVFVFHRDVARVFKQLCPDVQIGGFTAAFPDLEQRDFQRWRSRWKRFIDITGDEIDFYSLHLYDFPGINLGQKQFRKGCHMEATLDMIEHYSANQFGSPKPIVVSEYGSQLHDWFNQPWSPYRDWLCLKAMNSILIQLMQRPDRVVKAVPFVTAKAEWGFNEGGSGQPYYWRLLRRENEPHSYTGKYVFTDQIKFYELWSGVQGKRVLCQCLDDAIVCDAYVDGHHAYMIINNLSEKPRTIDLQRHGGEKNGVVQSFAKHLYQFEGAARLDVVDLMNSDQPLVIGPEGTLIIRETYQTTIEQEHWWRQRNHYSDKQLTAISAGVSNRFDVKGVETGEVDRFTLRLGIGRPHTASLQPSLLINGAKLESKPIVRGPSQKDRESFFGVLEYECPATLFRLDNQIEIQFPDEGGSISSLVLKHQSR